MDVDGLYTYRQMIGPALRKIVSFTGIKYYIFLKTTAHVYLE
jgi:hypothetical protein